jgi:hypothetical protein
MADNGNPVPNPQDSKSKQSWQDYLASLIAGLPPWARLITALVALGLLAAYGYNSVSTLFSKEKEKAQPGVTVNVNPPANAPASIQVGTASPPYTNGVPATHVASNKLPQNLEANRSATEDLAAYKYHFPDKQTPEMSILDQDKDHFIHYKFYSSDRCLWIERQWDGVNSQQWLRDPEHNLHDVQAASSARKDVDVAIAASNPEYNDLITIMDTLGKLRTVFATPHVPPAQAGCVNPHPGQFRYWWGYPLDNCNSPMFRQFSDGCTHYQVYNRCANAWDGRIFWTYCSRVASHY